MHNNNELIKLLLERDGAICSICGRPFSETLQQDISIDHIIPFTYQKDNSIDNLRLVHKSCNERKGANLPIMEFEFESFIKLLLLNNDNYNNIQTNIPLKAGRISIRQDLVFHRKLDSRKFVAEIKRDLGLTQARVDDTIVLMETYRKLDPKANLVLIIPGMLPLEYKAKLKNSNIELWDRDFISVEFKEQIASLEHPLCRQFQIDERQIFNNQIKELIYELKNCPSGSEYWSKYQALIGEIISFLFCPPLKQPVKELFDMNKINRRDFILPNYAQEGFWKFLRDQYHADYIVIDAKNSGKKIPKKDVLQIANYLKQHGAGLFAIIFSRKGQANNLEYLLSELWITQQKLIIILNDEDVEQMLLLKLSDESPDEIIQQKIEDFRLSI